MFCSCLSSLTFLDGKKLIENLRRFLVQSILHGFQQPLPRMNLGTWGFCAGSFHSYRFSLCLPVLSLEGICPILFFWSEEVYLIIVLLQGLEINTKNLLSRRELYGLSIFLEIFFPSHLGILGIKVEQTPRVGPWRSSHSLELFLDLWVQTERCHSRLPHCFK